ncbi:MAG TPA: hypothetical protein VEM15_10700 [Thermodesulfobacteriota bacterium]|nr:hypothetical protein [Thermodesulfobacteriota bacterium]
MKKKPMRILLAIVIASCVVASFTYGQYYTVASADFISHDLKLENFDHDYLSAVNQNQLKVYGSYGFLESFRLSRLFEQSFHLISQVVSLDQKELILRC